MTDEAPAAETSDPLRSPRWRVADDRDGHGLAAEAVGPLHSPLWVLTDRAQSEAAGRRLIDTVAAALDGGARTFVLREKDLLRSERYLLALSLTDLLVAAGAVLVVASDVAMALGVGAVAVHLTADDPVPDTRDWPDGMVWGRSCHGVDDVARAAHEGAGYVTLSPIFATPSKPGYGPPLGTGVLATTADGIDRTVGPGPSATSPAVEPGEATLARAANQPTHGLDGPSVLALGGVTPANAATCLEAGAAGVAVMGGIMAADDPAKATAAYLAALESVDCSPESPGRGADSSR